MADLSKTQSNDMPAIEWSKINNHYEHLTTETLESIIRQEVKNAKMAFISLGFFLRVAKEQETWKRQGYESIWEYAELVFHISRSTASRYMEINRRFSKEGCSAILDERYQDYNVGQLQEMLTLPDMQKVTPDMTVKEIRALKPKKERHAMSHVEEAAPQGANKWDVSGPSPSMFETKELGSSSMTIEITEDETCATSHMEKMPAESTDELIEEVPVAETEEMVKGDIDDGWTTESMTLAPPDPIEYISQDDWLICNFLASDKGSSYLPELMRLLRDGAPSTKEIRKVFCPNDVSSKIECIYGGVTLEVEFKTILHGIGFCCREQGIIKNIPYGRFARIAMDYYNPDDEQWDDETVADEPETVAEPETGATPEPEPVAEPVRIEIEVSSEDAVKKWGELAEGNKFTIQRSDIYSFLLDIRSELKNYRECNVDGTMPENIMKRKEADVMAYKLLLELVQKKDEIEAKRLEEGVE